MKKIKKTEDTRTNEEKRKHRHSLILLALASSISLGTGAAASYGVSKFIYNKNLENENNSTSGEENQRSNQDKLLNNLLASSSLQLDTLSANISGFYKDYSISLSGNKVAFNYLDSTLTYTETPDFAPKFSGRVNLKVDESATKNIADETLDLYIASNQVVFRRNGQYFTLNNDALGDIIGLFSTDSGMDLSGILSSLGGSSSDTSITDKRNDLLGQIQDCLSQAKETATADGYDFLLTLPDNLGTVTLSSDKSCYFKGAKADLNVTIKGKETTNKDGSVTKKEDTNLVIHLEAKGQQSTTTNLVSKDLLASLKEEGVDVVNLDGLDPLFYTFFNLAKSKAFDAKLKLGITDNSTKATKNATLRVSADLKGKDSEEGNLFQIALNENGTDTYVNGSAKATLRKDTAFIDLNGEKKGYLDYSSLSTRRDSFSQVTGTVDVRNVVSKVASLLNDCKLKDLLNGDFSVYKDFLKEVKTNTSGTYAKVVISSKALGLAQDEDHDIVLELEYASEKELGRDGIELKYAKVSNVPLKDHALSLEFGIDDLKAEKLAKVTSKEGYTSYNGARGIVSSFAKRADDKKFGLAYNIGISNEKYKTSYAFDGLLDADFSKLIDKDPNTVHPGKEYLDVEAAITAHTKRDEIDHYLDARRVDDTAYLSYDNVRKEYRENAEIGSIVDAVRNGVKKRNDVNTGTSIDVSAVLSKVMDSISSIFTVENGLNLTNLDSYIDISANENDPDHTFNRTVSPAILGLDGGVISIKTNTSQDKVLAVSATGIELLGYQFTFDIGYKEYVSPRNVTYYGKTFDAAQFKQDAGEPVEKFEYLVNGVFDLFTGDQKYSRSLKANLDSVDEKRVKTQKAALTGNINRSIKDSQYNGALTVNIGKDNEYQYKPKLAFDYNDPNRDNNSGDARDRLFVQYSGNAAKAAPIGINFYKGTVTSAVDRIKNASTNHPQNLILSLLKKINKPVSALPRQDLISGKVDPIQTVRNSNYVTKIDLRDGKVEIDLDCKAIGITEASDSVVKVNLSFDTSLGKITGLTIDDLRIKDRTFDLALGVTTLEASADVASRAEIKKTDNVKYISMDDVPLFLELGLNTTDKQVFTRDGRLRVQIPVLNDFVVKARLSAEINFGDSTKGEKTYYKFYINLTDYDNSYSTSYYFDSNSMVEGSETLDKGEVLIDYDDGASRSIRYVTTNEFVKHLGYYALGFGLNYAKQESSESIYSIKTELVAALDGLSLGGKKEDTDTPDASEETTTKTDNGGIMGTSILPETRVNYDKTGHKDNAFHLGLNLSTIDLGVTGINLGNDINVVLGHSDNSSHKGTFTSLSVEGEVVSVLDIASIGIDLELNKVEGFVLDETIQELNGLYSAKIAEKKYYQINDDSKVEQKYHHEFLGKGGYYYLSFADNNTLDNPTIALIDKK